MDDSEAELRVSLPSLRERLRDGRLGDAEFDQVFPHPVRLVSRTFWTPVAVALRATTLLLGSGATRILDVGSGAGKFCMVGALVSSATFTGIEHRRDLVLTARAASADLGIASVQFVHGRMEALDITDYDGIYIFNPFEENLWKPVDRLDQAADLSFRRFFLDVALVEGLLAMAKPGTCVVTYHGFGGRIPKSYRRCMREQIHTGHLEMWIKG